MYAVPLENEQSTVYPLQFLQVIVQFPIGLEYLHKFTAHCT